MCCSKDKKGCRRPEELRGKPGDCSPKQIDKCHGSKKSHPCVGKTEKK